jgi:tetratricopeptide (TPR) repeat protein
VLSPLEVGCRKCGRRARLEPGRLTALCARCSASADATYTVQKGSTSSSLPRSEVVERLRVGALSGTDWITDGLARPVPIASHPAFTGLFLPGHPEVLPFADGPSIASVPALARRTPWYQRPVSAAVAAAVLAVSIAVTLGNPVVRAAMRGWASVILPVVGPADPVDRLVLDVGTVDEPRALLLAQAWSERGLSTADGRDHAIALARRAVARSPYAPDALSMLAVLYAEAGEERELRDTLLARAVARGPGTPAVLHAQGVVALRQGDVPTARKAGEDCLSAGAPSAEPGAVRPAGAEYLPCRELLLDARPVTDEGVPQLLADYDALAEDWPANVALRARAAVLAASLDLPTAPARVAEVRRVLPNHPGLLAADAELRFADGDFEGARELVGRLGASSMPDIALRDAELALSEGNVDAALDALDPWVRTTPSDEAMRLRVRTLQAQAALLRSLQRPEDTEAIEALGRAARALEHADARSPAAVQARLLASCRSGDLGEADRAWSSLDPMAGTRRDLARVWATRAMVLYRPPGLCGAPPADVKAPPLRLRDATRAAEEGVSIDPSEPAPHVWRLLGRADVRDVKGLRVAILDALRGVDTRAERRNRIGGTLALPPPWADAGAALERMGRAEPDARPMLPLATATLAFLGGDLERARGMLPQLPPDDVATIALTARLALAAGDGAAALEAVDRLIAREPDEAAWTVARAEALVASRNWMVASLTLEAVEALRPEDAHVKSLRAETFMSLGRRPEAIAAANAALALDPLDVPARRVLRGASLADEPAPAEQAADPMVRRGAGGPAEPVVAAEPSSSP